jgi:DNA polymerase-3 subunit epsilon
LSEVYLRMTGGQTQIDLAEESTGDNKTGAAQARKLAADRPALRVIHASPEELEAHQTILNKMGETCRWPQ